MNLQQKVLQLKNVFIQFEIDYVEKELEEFASVFKLKEYKKGEIIQEVGSREEILGYITSGLVRFYFNTSDGKEFNQTFKCEHQIFSNYYATFLNEPAAFAIEALEDTTALVADNKDVQPFYDKSRCWDRLGRRVTEINFMYKAIREKDLLINDAATRLKNFYTYHDRITERISKHHLALYLGINPASLSRLLRKP